MPKWNRLYTQEFIEVIISKDSGKKRKTTLYMEREDQK